MTLVYLHIQKDVVVGCLEREEDEEGGITKTCEKPTFCSMKSICAQRQWRLNVDGRDLDFNGECSKERIFFENGVVVGCDIPGNAQNKCKRCLISLQCKMRRKYRISIE